MSQNFKKVPRDFLTCLKPTWTNTSAVSPRSCGGGAPPCESGDGESALLRLARSFARSSSIDSSFGLRMVIFTSGSSSSMRIVVRCAARGTARTVGGRNDAAADTRSEMHGRRMDGVGDEGPRPSVGVHRSMCVCPSSSHHTEKSLCACSHTLCGCVVAVSGRSQKIVLDVISLSVATMFFSRAARLTRASAAVRLRTASVAPPALPWRPPPSQHGLTSARFLCAGSRRRWRRRQRQQQIKRAVGMGAQPQLLWTGVRARRGAGGGAGGPHAQ